MENSSRTNNAIKNTFTAVAEQAAYTLLSFVCRTIFIDTLGKTYLGFSGLFSDILTLLSLTELGVGTAILYSMYEPAAKNDYKCVAALLNFYRKIYLSVGIIIAISGVCITPFLNFFISDIPNIPEIPIIYLLYLTNTAFSYLFIYKKSILIINQKSRISSLVYFVSTSIQNILQIVFLILTKNFIIYLIIHISCTIANNIMISIYVDKHYTYLKKYKDARIDKKAKREIFENVKALFFSKISSAIVTSTDNILISKFVSTVVLGMYSNYTLFTTMLRTILNKIFEALTGSVGNLIATEKPSHIYKVFREIWFVNYWLVAFCTSTLLSLINPFIKLWIGESYLLDIKIVFLICLNFYMRYIRNTFLIFIDTYGLFRYLKKKCVAEAAINFTVSLIFVSLMDMGIFGILLGTFISNILTNFWFEAYLIFVKNFGISLRTYFVIFVKYFIVMATSSTLSYYVCNVLISSKNWIYFGMKMIYCFLFINSLYVIIYRKTNEYAYLKDVAYKMLLRLKARKKQT